MQFEEDGWEQLQLKLEPGEVWWDGAVEDATRMPFGSETFTRDLGLAPGPGPNHGLGTAPNQSAPLLVSTRGRIIWSEQPFEFTFDEDCLNITGEDIVSLSGRESLQDAFEVASAKFLPPSGLHPDERMFTQLQYSTWIDQPHSPTQASVLAYAHRVLDADLPPRVLMIDDIWAVDYGI